MKGPFRMKGLLLGYGLCCAFASSAAVKWGEEGPRCGFEDVFAAQVGAGQLPPGRRGEAELLFHVGVDNAFAKSLNLDFASLHPYGYYLVKRGRDVLFGGRTPKGCSYAAFDFLKRYTGYRSFGGKFGEIVPRLDRLDLPEEFSHREEPDVVSYCCQWAPADERFGRNYRVTAQATHAMDQMVKPSMFAEHPEYFPLVGGRRVDPKSGPWNPCMANPDLPRLFLEYARGYFARNPEAVAVPMGVNDGGGDCDCEQCRAVFARHGNQYVEFYNLAAKILQREFPGKLLAFIGYSRRCGAAPKDGYGMEPNILVEVTGNVRNHAAWRACGVKHFGTYEYLYQLNNSRMVPGHYPHYLADFLRGHDREFGLGSFWAECFASTSVFDGARQYVQDELMWDLEADVDALLDDYFSRMYGPAASAMRRFFDTAEEAFADNPGRRTFFSEWRDPLQFNGYTFGRLARMDGALADAARSAPAGSAAARRVEIVSRYWAVSRLFADNWQCAKALAGTDDPGRMVELGLRGLLDIEAIDRCRIAEEDELEAGTDGKPGFFEAWKKVSKFDPRPPLDAALFAAFGRLVPRLGEERAREFLESVKSRPRIGPYASAQLALMDGRAIDIAANGGFEDVRRVTMPDDAEAHSGGHSFCIDNAHAGSWIVQHCRARPNTLYRLSFWAKCQPDGGSSGKVGSMSVRMKSGSGGWLDDGSAIEVALTTNAVGSWTWFSVGFSTPDVADGLLLVPILSSPTGLGPNYRLWIDDLKIEEAASCEPYCYGQAEFAEATLREWLRPWGVPLPKLVRDSGFRDGAFAAERRDDGGALLRGDEEGLRVGLYQWAFAQGVRWFSPAEMPIVPAAPETIPDSFWGEHRPSFPYRGLHTCGARYHFDATVAHWMSFNGMNRRLDTLEEAWRNRREIAKYGLRSDTTVHAFDTLIPAKKYLKEHPEYFPLVGGERLAEGAQRCLGDVGCREAFAHELAEWIEKVPDAAAYGVCPNDGYGWCECAACKALDTDEDRRNGTVNGRMAAFVGELCERFPDRMIGNYSYSCFRDFYRLYDKVPTNLVLSTTISHCQGHPLADGSCPTNRRVHERLAELSASHVNFYVYDYYTYLWGELPAPMWQTVAADMKELKRLGAAGFLSEVGPCRDRSWSSFAPSLYMAARLLWNVDETADAVIADWCRVRYGAAAPAMEKYFHEWEKGVPMDRCFLKKPSEYARVFQSGAGQFLQEAESLAPENPFVRKSRRLYDAWRLNLEERRRWPAVRKIRVAPGLAKVPLSFVRNTTQVGDRTNPTEVEMELADGKLHARLTLKESNMGGLRENKGDMTASDSVELFFADGCDDSVCYHFVIDSAGSMVASECKGTRWNWNWKHGAHALVRRNAGSWVVDFDLPLEDIGEIDSFRFSFVRNRFAGGSWEIFGAPEGGAYFNTRDYIAAEP